jgi:hypothetical protein
MAHVICMLSVARCTLSCYVLHVVRCMAHVCCMSSVACCRVTQRAAVPAHRGGACNLGRSDRRGPLQTEVCVRACVRACVWVASVTVCLCGLLCVRRRKGVVARTVEYKRDRCRMSSIIKDGDTYHGISVFGRGVFSNDEDDTYTYAGQCRDGHACGLGLLTWSSGKEYAEHGVDGNCDGRCLRRSADGDTEYWLFERGVRKEHADVYADGRCWYNFEACAPDDPRVLALIAQVAPVEVRPAARAPHRPLARPLAPKPSSDGSAGSFCRRRRSPPPWPPRCTPMPHAVADVRATQPNSSKARPRSGACTGRVGVGGARVGASCTLTTAHLVHTKPR